MFRAGTILLSHMQRNDRQIGAEATSIHRLTHRLTHSTVHKVAFVKYPTGLLTALWHRNSTCGGAMTATYPQATQSAELR